MNRRLRALPLTGPVPGESLSEYPRNKADSLQIVFTNQHMNVKRHRAIKIFLNSQTKNKLI